MTREERPSSERRQTLSRRGFVASSGALAAGSVLAGVAIPHVHAAEDNTIRLALIGCGGRGTGAVANALTVPNGNAKLVAMADVFQNRIDISHKNLAREFGAAIDVPADRQFVGFDAYRKAIDCLRPGDVALLTTHSGFRPIHLEYAVENGVNAFMEKSFASDPVGIRRIIQAGEAAEKKNLKIAAGLMCRHSPARQALIRKIRDGELGEIHLIRAYRMSSASRLDPRPEGENELMYQIRRSPHFLWASSGRFIGLMVHQIDECCWIKDAWPVSAHGVGGRTANSPDCSENHDSYSIEYTFADGAKALVVGRYIANCFNDFSTYLHGTKCAAQFSGDIHAPTVRTYKDQRVADDKIAWSYGFKEDSTWSTRYRGKESPWQEEWNVLLAAIRDDRPHNEAKRAAYSDLASIMGRAAVHSGKVITWDEAMASNFQFCPDLDAMTESTPAPVQSDAEGRYAPPVPGQWTEI
ncbi:MAG: gfo/Idh/MocA family oxidoreductase [Patescibacteria group bacterium]|nr:gfo/Idh/MocA family oxidoreductase [Patescibacteria group bacterium]